MNQEIKYRQGEEVTVLNIRGEVAGKAIVESYQLMEEKYKVWFLYASGERELIQVPALLIVGGKARKIFEPKTNYQL